MKRKSTHTNQNPHMISLSHKLEAVYTPYSHAIRHTSLTSDIIFVHKAHIVTNIHC